MKYNKITEKVIFKNDNLKILILYLDTVIIINIK